MNKRPTKKDKMNVIQAYYKKLEEYDKLTLQELTELFPPLKATYREACIAVVDKKLRAEKEANFKELIENSKVEEAVVIENTKTIENE